LRKGDLVLMYTDGVTEIVGSAGQVLDESGLIIAVQENLDQDVSFIAGQLMENIEKFNRKSSFEDDVTFIIGRYSGMPAEGAKE
jgi:serine phosphatase RsbU (regulator of sigma subunit)